MIKKRFYHLFLFILSLFGAANLQAVSRPTAPTTDGELIFSTFLGGELADGVADIAVDSSSRTYITGHSNSTQFPSPNPSFNEAHGVDAYVARLNADGTAVDYLFWFNAIAANDIDQATSIAIDGDGGAYVTGFTRSPDFCQLFGVVPGHDTSHTGVGDTDAFLFKVKPDGSGLDYCTFLGGNDWDSGTAVSVDSAGSATVSGSTWSLDFPVTANAIDPSHNGLRDSFIATFDPTGTQLTYATYLGGDGQEESKDMVFDSDGNLIITGWSNSTTLATATREASRTDFDAFLLKYDPAANQILHAQFIGGTGDDRPTELAMAANQAITLAGYTDSSDFPTTPNAHQTQNNGLTDAFLLQMSSDGTTLNFASLFGGPMDDQANALVIGQAGIITLVGFTASDEMFGADVHLNGDQDAFIAQFSPHATALLSGQFLGGRDTDRATAVALAPDQTHILAGATRSDGFPISHNAYDSSHNGDFDGFITRLRLPNHANLLYLPIIANP